MCLETKELGECLHTDDERALESVFVSVELDKALQLGSDPPVSLIWICMRFLFVSI